MRVMKVAQDRHIVLPKRLFQPADTVLVMTEGDTLVIKKMRPRLSSIAQRVRGSALLMRTVVREVRAYRKRRLQA
jgi:virulence-associated protein VagC